MHLTLGFCNGVLAFSTLVSASYRDHPRNYVRNLKLDNSSTPTSSLTSSSSSLGISFNTSSSTSSPSVSDSSSDSTTSIEIITTSQPSCVGSVTYFSTTPPTVYETTTIPFTVTVTAANVSLTTPAIYTPPPPCFQSVIIPLATSSKCTHNCPLNNPDVTETATGSAYTSTVLVTKKTPVPTVVPDTSAPPNFHTPTSTPLTSPTPAPGGQPGSPTPVVQSLSPRPAGNSATPTPGNSQGSDDGQGSGGSNANGPTHAASKTTGNDGSEATAEPGQNSPATKGGQTATPNIGSLVNSGINGLPLSTPAANKGTTSANGPEPTTANVHGVPVIVLPSSSGVVIGGQIVSVPPSGSTTTVVANGNTFTLGKSSIVGPGTTIAFAADQTGGSPTPITANGLTFRVGATQAILSGKTYAIGAGASTTTLNIGGQTVVVGPSGVGVPGQTIAPAKTIAGSSMSVETAGGVTITYDKSEAIVGSSTFRIGQGASQTVITVNGKTVSLGVSGLGLASSTIPPAKVTAAPSLSAVTVDGVSFSVDATEVVVGSSTFRIGSDAPTETTVINGKTVSIGPSGVGLGSTTVRPLTATATAGLQTGGAASAIRESLTSSSVLLTVAALLGLFSCMI